MTSEMSAKNDLRAPCHRRDHPGPTEGDRRHQLIPLFAGAPAPAVREAPFRSRIPAIPRERCGTLSVLSVRAAGVHGKFGAIGVLSDATAHAGLTIRRLVAVVGSSPSIVADPSPATGRAARRRSSERQFRISPPARRYTATSRTTSPTRPAIGVRISSCTRSRDCATSPPRLRTSDAPIMAAALSPDAISSLTREGQDTAQGIAVGVGESIPGVPGIDVLGERVRERDADDRVDVVQAERQHEQRQEDQVGDEPVQGIAQRRTRIEPCVERREQRALHRLPDEADRVDDQDGAEQTRLAAGETCRDRRRRWRRACRAPP